MVVKAVKICASLWFFQSRLFETASQTREMRITHAILDKKLALREAVVGRRRPRPSFSAASYVRPRAPGMFPTALPARKNDEGNFTFGGLRNVEIHDHNCGRCHKRRIHRPPRPLPPALPTF